MRTGGGPVTWYDDALDLYPEEPACPCEIPGTGREGDCAGAACPHRAARWWPLPDVDADRAAELDDRPARTLESIARDIEAEAKPSLAELLAERYGRGAA